MASSPNLGNITFEITETYLDVSEKDQDSKDTRENLDIIRLNEKTDFAIDDWGKDGSNYEQVTDLRRFLGDKLQFFKIDSRYIANIHTDTINQDMILSMIDYARRVWGTGWQNHVIVE